MSAQPPPPPGGTAGTTDDLDATRNSILTTAATLLRDHPLHHVTLDMVANAASLEPEVIRTRFPTLDDLVADVVDVWHTQRLQPILAVAKQHGAVAFLRAVLRTNLDDPALLRLLTASVSIAATPDLAAAVTLQTRWIRFHATVQRALSHDIEVGREPDTMDPARGAEQLIALYDGLQLQSMLRPHLNVLEAYDRAVTRLRGGWSSTYTPPIWSI